MKNVMKYYGIAIICLAISSLCAMDEEVPLLEISPSLVLLTREIEQVKNDLTQLGCLARWGNAKRSLDMKLNGLLKQKDDAQRQERNLEQYISCKNGKLGIWADNKQLSSGFCHKVSLDEKTMSALTTINISNNIIEVFPIGHILHACKHIENIDVSHNRIKVITYRYDDVPYQIVGNRALKALNLSYNNIESFDNDTQFIASPHLENLDLSNNPLTTCTWNDSNAWNVLDETGTRLWEEREPRINLKDTQLLDDAFEALKKCYVEKNKAIREYKALSVGICIGVLPAAGTAVGLSFIAPHSVLTIAADLLAGSAVMGFSTGIGRLVGRYCVPQEHLEHLRSQANNNILH